MTKPESEQATQSLSERAAREYVKTVHVGGLDPYPLTIFEHEIEAFELKAHEAGQVHGEKTGFYTAIARMESALQKISDEAKEKWPDCPDWWGVVWGMKAAIEEMKEQT